MTVDCHYVKTYFLHILSFANRDMLGLTHGEWLPPRLSRVTIMVPFCRRGRPIAGINKSRYDLFLKIPTGRWNFSPSHFHIRYPCKMKERRANMESQNPKRSAVVIDILRREE